MSYKPNPRLARVLDTLFILHAEHEMNCSTSAARHLASRFVHWSTNHCKFPVFFLITLLYFHSGVDVYTAIAGAVGALYGPLHGGANEVPSFIEGVKNR